VDPHELGWAQSLKKQLIELIREKSYREGDFVLASGARSSFYIDMKASTLHPQGAELIGVLAVQACEAKGIITRIQGVGGLTLGADPIATAVSLAAWKVGIEWPAFLVRKESKGHGTARTIEGTENLAEGAELLVVEDVATTGRSALDAVFKLREAGFRPIAVLSIVDRRQGAEEAISSAGLTFIPLCSIEEIRKP